MNSTLQLKNNLITRINNSDDLDFLKALQTIFDSSEQSLFKLNEKQNASIQQGRDDIRKGNSTEHDMFMQETKEWLENK